MEGPFESSHWFIYQVTNDKQREVREGYDGTWVAHPDLVKLAKDIFVEGLDGRDNQVDKQRDDVSVSESDLTDMSVEGGKISEEGMCRLFLSVLIEGPY